MSFIAHPDYLTERRERNVYEALLDYLRQLVEHEKIWLFCREKWIAGGEPGAR